MVLDLAIRTYGVRRAPETYTLDACCMTFHRATDSLTSLGRPHPELSIVTSRGDHLPVSRKAESKDVVRVSFQWTAQDLSAIGLPYHHRPIPSSSGHERSMGGYSRR